MGNLLPEEALPFQYWRDITQKTFDGFNLKIPDTSRYKAWERDFDSLLANNKLPQLMTIRFGNDHTEGMAAGRPTPYAHVADNDLAIGQFMEHLSKSPVWKESVVFMLEDDAQNGPDHVDAHRSPAYIAGGYVKRNFVDHTMYTTSSMIHTIELILGMPPMTQYDAAAVPMWRCFSQTPDITPFIALPEKVNLLDVNPANTKLADMSKGLDFFERRYHSRPDHERTYLEGSKRNKFHYAKPGKSGIFSNH